VTITEALKIIQSVPPDSQPFAVIMACGFTPLHLQTLLTARLQRQLPKRRVKLTSGLFGDLAGTLESLIDSELDAALIVIEWPDLDPRLGLRSLAPWSVQAVADILDSARTMLDRIAVAIRRIPPQLRVALVLPTLPFPPLFHTASWQAAETELLLHRDLAQFASQIAQNGRVHIASASYLAEQSPLSTRLDLKSYLLTGFPYTLSHADQVAAAATRLLLPAPPKKGIISDLDDTLWAGIAGEVGPDGVGWDLAGHNQLHGLYQTLLAALSEQGTLIAVASKNDPSVVRKVFERSDLLLRPERIFPIEVHWQAKSGSVSRILETWNIGSDAVIFVDDSPMELAEVAAVHPEIETILFPNRDYDAGLATLRRLRDLCAKERVSHDDTIRLDSIRKGVEFQQQVSSTSTPEHFLAQLHAVLSFDFAAEDPRVLELVNKTNQFNLNGLRYTDSDWHKQCSQPGAICVAVAYEDKFGPLGTISVIQGVTRGQTLHVETWVMSCRAFSRRIEHQCLRVLFDRTGVDTIDFQFKSTAKNGPMRDFLTAIMGKTPDCPCFLSCEIFDKYCPALYHQTTEIGRTAANG